ncbi:hypothetical protein VDG1235_1742 [Verrucomicrobiia bacterium DG1235]|nr:hypothetical protein VDG1235_1742 [Verrucomicrobiae bacterium DG1235]
MRKRPKVSVSTFLILAVVGVAAIWLQYGDVFHVGDSSKRVSLENFYFEDSFPTVSGERRIAVSLRAGSVDFLVMMHGDNRGYPKYVGGQFGTELAIGHILLDSFEEGIELLGTGKAYQISEGGVRDMDFPARLDALEVADLVGSLKGDFTLERLEEAARELGYFGAP